MEIANVPKGYGLTQNGNQYKKSKVGKTIGGIAGGVVGAGITGMNLTSCICQGDSKLATGAMGGLSVLMSGAIVGGSMLLGHFVDKFLDKEKMTEADGKAQLKSNSQEPNIDKTV